MLTGHAQNWLVDNVAFALSLVPLASLSLVVLVARLESNRRKPATVRVRSCSQAQRVSVR